MKRVTHINSYFASPLELVKSSDFLRIVDMILDNCLERDRKFKKDYIAWLIKDIWERKFSYREQMDLRNFLKDPSVRVLWIKYTENTKIFTDLKDKDPYEIFAFLRYKEYLFEREKWYERICFAIEDTIWLIDNVIW